MNDGASSKCYYMNEINVSFQDVSIGSKSRIES